MNKTVNVFVEGMTEVKNLKNMFDIYKKTLTDRVYGYIGLLGVTNPDMSIEDIKGFIDAIGISVNAIQNQEDTIFHPLDKATIALSDVRSKLSGDNISMDKVFANKSLVEILDGLADGWEATYTDEEKDALTYIIAGDTVNGVRLFHQLMEQYNVALIVSNVKEYMDKIDTGNENFGDFSSYVRRFVEAMAGDEK